MGIVAEGHVDTPVDNLHLPNELARGVGRSRTHTCFRPPRWRLAIHVVCIDNWHLGACGHIHALGDLGAHRVCLVSRHSQGGKNTNDRDDDHELYQSKSLLSDYHIDGSYSVDLNCTGSSTAGAEGKQ